MIDHGIDHYNIASKCGAGGELKSPRRRAEREDLSRRQLLAVAVVKWEGWLTD